MNVGILLSPVIAGFLYGTFGMKSVLIINSISFTLSAISEMFINVPKTHKSPEKISFQAFKTDLVEGINVIKENRMIAIMISLGTIINFSAAPLFGIGLIYIIKEILLVSDIQFGLLQMVMSISMLAAPILCGGIMRKYKMGKLVYLSFLIVAILILIMSIIPSDYFLNSFNSNLVPIIGITIISFIVSLIVTIANIALGTLFNQVVPLELMGRTSTVFNFTVTIFIPIGQMIFGYLYDIISPSIVIIISGAILLFAIIKYKAALLDYDDSEPKAIGDMINEL